MCLAVAILIITGCSVSNTEPNTIHDEEFKEAANTKIENRTDVILEPKFPIEINTQIHNTNSGSHEASSSFIPNINANTATHTAIKSGIWSDNSTWTDGIIPTEGSQVYIPHSVIVGIADTTTSRVKSVLVDGTLQFAYNVNTKLPVDTLITNTNGKLIIGTAKNPIESSVRAEIVFADFGPIEKSSDPKLIGRGAILAGETIMYGSTKTAFLPVAVFPRKGDRSVILKNEPQGWEIGDSIVIAGTDPKDPTTEQMVTITDIQNNTVLFDSALVADHVAPRGDLDVHVANLVRNIEFRSESKEPKHRAHVMLMHTNNADINYVTFKDLGRSDKIVGYDDHEFIDLDPYIPARVLGGDNVRGRYSFHVHRGGTDKNTQAAKITGSVVVGSPGWGFVSHSSHVDFKDNVAYDIVGAAYFTEAGDEIGSFIDNIAIRIVHPNDPLNSEDEIDPDIREDLQDYGFQGDGFWFHGPNVRVEGNIVSGVSGHAYIWWPEGLLERESDGSTKKVFHDTANVVNGNLIGPDGTRMEIFDVPIKTFIKNQAYSATKGIQIFYLHTEFFDDGIYEEDGVINPSRAYDEQLRSTISESIVWNIEQTAYASPYANRVTLENSRFIGSGDKDSIGIDIGHFRNEIGLEVFNNVVEDFGVGLKVTSEGEVTERGNILLNNDVNRMAVVPNEDEDEDDEDLDCLEDASKEDQELEEKLFDESDAIYDKYEREYESLDDEIEMLESADASDEEFEAVYAKFDALDKKSGMDKVDAQLEALYEKYSCEDDED